MKRAECFLKKYKSLSQNLKKVKKQTLKTGTPETIHQLRVSLKKTNAFFRLLESINSEFDASEAFKPFKKIFKKAGRVRDINVQSDLLKKLEKEFKMKVSHQHALLKKKEKNEFQSYKKYLKKNAGRFDKKIGKKELKIFDDDPSLLKIKLYLVKQLEQIIDLMTSKKIDNSRLHKIRIQLKEYFYNVDLVNECILKNKIIVRHLAQLHELQDQLGKWHDRSTMYNFTGEPDQQLSREEKKSMRHLHSKLGKSNKELTRDLKKQFPPMLINFERIKNGLTGTIKNQELRTKN